MEISRILEENRLHVASYFSRPRADLMRNVFCVLLSSNPSSFVLACKFIAVSTLVSS